MDRILMASIVAMAWPITILIIINKFEDSIRLFFKMHLRKMAINESNGVAADLQNTETPFEEVVGAKSLLQLTQNGTVNNPLIEKYKISRFDKVIQEREQTTKEDKLKIMYDLLIDTWFSASFERIYQAVYGSQMSALLFLADSSVSVGRERLQDFYDLAVEQSPDFYKKVGFSKWLNFLEVNLLIKDLDNDIFITEEGKAFLKYVDNYKCATEKAF